MQMEAVKAALQDLLAAMDSEDKRVLQEKLSGGGKPEVEVEVESEGGEPADGKCPDCGNEPCTCEE